MTITYWGNPRPDGSGGTEFDAPISINARWQDRTEETFDDKGRAFVSRARVFVDRDVTIGGYLFNGISLIVDPTELEGAYQIMGFTKISNMGRTKFERKAIL